MDSFFAVVFVLVAVATAMGACFVMPRLRAPLERGERPLYEEVGLGWKAPLFGGLSAASNFSPYRFSAYEDFVVIGTLTRTVIPYGDILWLKKGVLNQVSLKLRNEQKVMLMVPRRSENLVEILRAKGVSVKS
jgi:hypothetical protein